MRSLCLLVATGLGAAGLIAQDDAVRIDILRGPVQLGWNRDAEDWSYAGRVVDAITHAGIPGAVLYSAPERSRPLGGVFWYHAKFVADAFGFMRLPVPAPGGWFVYDTPGYGVASASSSPHYDDDMLQQLMPGLPWRVAVRDGFDRPVADAELGYCVGCGHTPDVRVARTDRFGIAVLTDCEPTGWTVHTGNDIYVRAAGVSPEYESHEWQLGDPPTVVRQDFARTIRGTVLAPDGRPLAGAMLRGNYGLHRGPYTWTGDDGAFTINVDRDYSFGLEVLGFWFDVYVPAMANELTVRLPASPDEPAPALAPLTIVVLDAVAGTPIEGVAVTAWQVGVEAPDSSRADVATDAQGRCTVELPAGPIAVHARLQSERDEPMAAEPVLLDLALPATGLEQRVVMVPRPTVTVTCPPNTAVSLRTREGTWDLEAALAEGRAIPVPAAAPFALLASAGESTRFHVFTAPPQQPVHIAPWQPTRVRLQVLAADRSPFPARVTITNQHEVPEPEDAEAADDTGEGAEAVPLAAAPVTESATGWHELDTWRVGCAFLFVEPLDGEHRPFGLHLALPELGERRIVDLGDLVAPRLDAPILRVLQADGQPLDGNLEIVRPGLRVRGNLAGDGGWNGMRPAAGDRILVHCEHRYDAAETVPTSIARITTRLVGDGPWTLQQGRGTVRFDVRDDHGLPLEEGTLLFGIDNYGINSARELQGLLAGEHEFFIGAVGCDSARVRVRLADGERRVVQLTLPRLRR